MLSNSKTNLSGLLAAFLLLTSGCYSEYVTMRIESHHEACWDIDSAQVAVIISSRAWRAPEGATRFPDGGRSKMLTENVALYVFHPASNQITEVDNFSDLTELIGSNRSTWDAQISFTDSLVIYRVGPVHDWDFMLSLRERTPEDSLRFRTLQKKYAQYFAYDLATRERWTIDSLEFQTLHHPCRQARLTPLNEQLKEVELEKLGLRIRDIQETYRRPDKQFIEETIHFDNRSALTRRAVFEQIIVNLKPEEIEKLLRRMDRHKNRLKEPDKSWYIKNMQEIYDAMQVLAETE